MASNVTKRNAMNHAEARQKIKTTQLINRLQSHVLGEKHKGSAVDLSPTQVTAALGLLRKAVPDIQNVALSGDAENPVVTKIITEIVDPKGD